MVSCPSLPLRISSPRAVVVVAVVAVVVVAGGGGEAGVGVVVVLPFDLVLRERLCAACDKPGMRADPEAMPIGRQSAEPCEVRRGPREAGGF